MRLQIQQLPHEYLFLQEHFPLILQKQDIHLVGEFVECLRIFGVAENSSLILEGMHFLLEEQNEDGSWDNHMKEMNVDEAYVAYHDGQPFNDNMLRPCPMLENPEKLRAMVKSSGAHSTDLQSPETVDHLCAKCDRYAAEWKPTADKLWAENRAEHDAQ